MPERAPVMLSQAQFGKMALMLGLFVVIVLAAGAVLLLLRRKYLGPSDGPQRSGMTLESLRDLRGSGEISEEEHARLRRIVLGLGPEVGENPSCSSSDPEKGDDEETGEDNLSSEERA